MTGHARHSLLLILMLGCAPRTGVQGGTLVPYSQFTTRPALVLHPAACHKRDGSPTRVPHGVEYELFQRQEGPLLLERIMSEKQGRLMHNRWVADDGLHYFVWLHDLGIEYVVPSRPDQPGQRRLYRRPKLHSFSQNGQEAVQPIGQPEVVCDLMAMR
jgi:hypothetical protein